MSKVQIVAECGINSNGDIGLAKQQIDMAVAAGVDAVKFQVYSAEKLVGMSSPLYKDTKQGQFSYKDLAVLYDYSPVEWFASAFDVEAVGFLNELGVERFKIASRTMTNKKVLEAITKTGKPILLSTGRHDTGTIAKTLEIVKGSSVTLLYCVPNYPTKIQDVNFGRMNGIKDLFKLPVGFSDHTTGIWASLEAVRLGAVLTEKHFTVSRSLPGCDQVCSLEFPEMKLLVKSIRQLECYRVNI